MAENFFSNTLTFLPPSLNLIGCIMSAILFFSSHSHYVETHKKDLISKLFVQGFKTVRKLFGTIWHIPSKVLKLRDFDQLRDHQTLKDLKDGYQNKC